MNIQELAEAAGDRINKKLDFMTLVMPQRKKQYRGYYLAGRNSPKGESMGTCLGGEAVHFDPIDILAFCVAHGAEINVRTEN